MGKNMVFNLHGRLFTTEPVKIERKKLYGFSKTFVYDENGHECETVSLDEGACGIIPKGGLGMGILSPEGVWVERSALKAVDMHGRDAPLFESSYDCTTTLDKALSTEDFLDYCITGFYKLSGKDFAQAIGTAIYAFDYCYRASYEPSAAFVLAAGESAFLLIGHKAKFEMLSLPEEVSLDDDAEEIDESDEIDFSMI